MALQTVQSPLSIRRFFSMRTSKGNLTMQNVSQQDNRVGQTNASEEVDKTSQANGRPDEEPVTVRHLFSGKVIVAAVNYSALALTDIAIRAVQPVFFATPIELGGLGLPPYMIGRILSVSQE